MADETNAPAQKSAPAQAKDNPDSLTSKTTAEQDRVTAGQREVNLIWENTQMRVALTVIWTSLAVASMMAIFGRWLGSPDLQLGAVVFLWGVANNVTGFYFGRTNHTRSGGVGSGQAGER